jgi:hypothetical protein
VCPLHENPIHWFVEASETRGTTALVYLQLHSSLYTGTVHVLSSVAGVHLTGLTADQGCRQVSTGLPPSSVLGWKEKRSEVGYRGCGTCEGAAGPGYAKTSSLGRKRFRERLVAAPEVKVKKPAGLKTRPAWLRQDCLGANPAVCRRRHGLPGVASVAIIERLKGWNQAALTDPDEGGGEQLGWQLAGQVGARIVPRQRRSRNMEGFGKCFDNGVN